MMEKKQEFFIIMSFSLSLSLYSFIHFHFTFFVFSSGFGIFGILIYWDRRRCRYQSHTYHTIHSLSIFGSNNNNNNAHSSNNNNNNPQLVHSYYKYIQPAALNIYTNITSHHYTLHIRCAYIIVPTTRRKKRKHSLSIVKERENSYSQAHHQFK